MFTVGAPSTNRPRLDGSSSAMGAALWPMYADDGSPIPFGRAESACVASRHAFKRQAHLPHTAVATGQDALLRP